MWAKRGSGECFLLQELMRRITPHSLERNGDGDLQLVDVETALKEMLVRSGMLNLNLLSAIRTES